MRSTTNSRNRPRRRAAATAARAALSAAAVLACLTLLPGARAAEPDPAEPTATPVAGMQQEKIRLIAGVGFDPNLSMTKRGCWARVAVLLENQWRSVDGTLRIQKGDAEFRSLIYEQPLDLPKNSRKLWTGYILTDDDQNLSVEYYSGRRRLASEPVAVLPRSPAEVFVMALTTEESRREFSYITVKGGEASAEFGRGMMERRQGRYLVFAEPRLLPREVIGYHSTSAFLWDGGVFGEFEKDQELALKSWLYMGGTLIVAAGENAAAVRQSFLHEILPVEVIGPRSVVLDGDFRDAFGSMPAPGEPRVIGLASLRQGNVIMGTEQRPLIVEGRYGAGRIVYVAFSLGSWDLKNWQSNPRLLDILFQPARPHLLNQLSGEARWTIDSKLKDSLLAKLPSAMFIVAFLGVYIILVVPVNYFVFRALKRVEYAWLALPVVAIAFGLLAYNIGYVKQSKTLDCDEVTLVEGRAGCPVVLAKTFMAIYSPTRINQPIRFPERCVLARPLIAQGYVQMGNLGSTGASDSRNPLSVTFDKGFEVSDFLIHPWAARSFESDYVADLGGFVEARLMPGSSGPEGKILNRLAYHLHDVALVTPNGNAWRLGELPSGSSLSLDASGHQSMGVGGYFEGVLRHRFDPRQATRVSAARPFPPGFPGGFEPGGLRMFQQNAVAYGQSWFGGTEGDLLPPNTCLLVGWADRSLLDVEIGRPRSPRTLNRRGRTLFHFIKIPIDQNTADLKVIGEGYWQVTPVVGEDDQTFVAMPGYDPLGDYMRMTNRSFGVHLLQFGENVLSIRSDTLPVDAQVDSLKIAYALDKKRLHQGNTATLDTSLYKLALYDFTASTWIPFESGKDIGIDQDVARFLSGREIRLKLDVTDNEIRPNQRGGPYNYAQAHAFLHDVKVTANLK